MIDKQLLLQGCKQFEIELSTQAAEQLDTYAQLLVEWNGKMNLTAITDLRASSLSTLWTACCCSRRWNYHRGAA